MGVYSTKAPRIGSKQAMHAAAIIYRNKSSRQLQSYYNGDSKDLRENRPAASRNLGVDQPLFSSCDEVSFSDE
jgi:hypothetical protein